MALNFNLLAQEGPKNLYEGFEQGRQAVAQNALAQQKLAQEGEMMSMRRQEFQSNLESSQAERRRKATVEKTAMFRDRILRAPTPQAARELVRMQHSDPDLGPVMQQLGSLDQDLADIPDDPTGFERWRQREAMGAAEFIKSQASERGFQDLLARVKGEQQGAAVAPAMPSSAPGAMAAPAELAAGVQPEPMTPVPGVISTSRVPGVTTAPISMPAVAGEGVRGIVPAVNTLAPPAAAPVNAMLAAQPAGKGRTPEQIRAEIDQLSMSSDPRAVRMVQTLTKEYEAALRGEQVRAPKITVLGVAKGTETPVYFDEYANQQFTIGAGPSGQQVRVPYMGGVNRSTSTVTATASSTGGKLESAEQKGQGELNIKNFEEIRAAAKLAQKTLPAIETQARILDQGFTTGFGTEFKKAGASVLAALGVQNAEKFATNAQTFIAATQQAVLQKQLEQKGTQTAADADRITQTGAQLGNTVNGNRFIIDVAKAQLKRDMDQRDFYAKWWSTKKTYEGAEDAWYAGEGGKSLFDRPELKKYVAPTAAETNQRQQGLADIFKPKPR